MPEKVGWELKGKLITFSGGANHPIDYARFSSDEAGMHDIEIRFNPKLAGGCKDFSATFLPGEKGHELGSMYVKSDVTMHEHIPNDQMPAGERGALLLFLREHLDNLAAEIIKHPDKAEAKLIAKALSTYSKLVEAECWKTATEMRESG